MTNTLDKSTETLIEEAVKDFLINTWGWSFEDGNWFDSTGELTGGIKDLQAFISTIATKSAEVDVEKIVAEAIKTERNRIVEIIKGFETNGQTRLLSDTGFWTSHDLLDKQELLKALENNES